MSKRQRKRNKRKNAVEKVAEVEKEEEQVKDVAGLLFYHEQDITFEKDSFFTADSSQLHSESANHF